VSTTTPPRLGGEPAVTIRGAGPSAYPEAWEFDALLTDGAAVHVRPIRPDDAAGLVALHGRLSPETVYRRFFSPHPVLSAAEVQRFTTVDYRDRFALVALAEGQLVAVARFERLGASSDAEVAFVVEDRYQGRGTGTLLLEHLAAAARERGITRFVAETLSTNTAMLAVFANAGFQVEHTYQGGTVTVRFPVDETDEAMVAMEGREHTAEVASLRRLLRPASIAVVGASRQPGTIGHEVLRNLLIGGFNGPVYPVNPAARHVCGVHAYPSVADLPEPPDLAVITAPADQVPAVVTSCGQAGTGAVVVISAGFAETGAAGREAERRLVRRARDHGMRLVGPNCMGVLNTAADVSMNATFAPAAPVAGHVAFLSQSGALGIAVLERAASMGLGLSSFVSVGNKADVSSNDLLQYWESDPETAVILLYLESFGNPRKFARIARRVAHAKPIVAVKSGRTTSGARAAQSHTAAAATSDVASDALFHQAGVIRVDTVAELFDVALLLAHQPVPAGNRVAVVSNSGGPGILAADACDAAGLELAELAPATTAALRGFLPREATVTNPVDLIASASGQQYERALQLVLADQAVDAALVIFTPPLVTRVDDVAAAVCRAAAAAGSKTVVAVFLGVGDGPGVLPRAQGERAVPSFPFPEAAVRALGRSARYGMWKAQPEDRPAALAGIDRGGAQDVVERVLADNPTGGWLDAADAVALTGAFGIPTIASAVAATAEEAAARATEIGFPVALKAAAGALVHKSDLGGVRLDLADADEVREAFAAMTARLGPSMGAAVIQAIAAPGVETIVGVVQDPAFGPLIMFGLGGVATDLLGDRAFRILPLTTAEARDLVTSLRSAPLLFGYRGAPPVDIDALCDVVLRVAQLAHDVPEVAEVDLNPVVATVTGAVAVDVKIKLQPYRPGPGPLLRRLR
jgi:acetyl coenzyme A synthetase (ADP forming)-like protein